MRLFDILFKPAECWRLGMGLLKRCLGDGPKSRRIKALEAEVASIQSSSDKIIGELRNQLAIQQVRFDTISKDLEIEKREHRKQKLATSQMWKFIHTRHRIDVPAEAGSIRQLLQKAERQ